jgi:hypothetical protein
MAASHRLLTTACIAALVLTAGVGVAQDAPGTATTTVAPLTVTPLPMEPVPDVGPGAPQLSPAEIRAAGEEVRHCARNLSSSTLAAVTLRQQVDSIAQAAVRHDGRIVLNPYNGEENERAAAVVVRDTARIAEQATLDLEAARRDIGKVSLERLKGLELARQQAVNRLVTAQAILTEIRARDAERQQARRQGLPAPIYDLNRRSAAVLVGAEPAYADLAFDDVSARQQLDKGGGAVLMVTGKIRNTRQGSIKVPPLRVTAFDKNGFPLKSQTVYAERQMRIQPGAAEEFAYQLRPSPRNAAKVTVAFGSNDSMPLRRTIPGCE